jgi:hypothetical protein
MEKFEISVTEDSQNRHLEVLDYMHHNGQEGHCKYEVFEAGQFIGSFEPGMHHHLNICKDPGVVSEGLLHLIAEQLERYHI